MSGAGAEAAPLRLGVVLPTFTADGAAPVAAAREAEASGLDGVFCYDHLWPMGHPGRPALSAYPVLGAVAAATDRIHLGTLVARVGLTDDTVLLETLLTVDQVSGGRLVTAIGTGDHKSAAENLAFGIPFAAAIERRALLRSLVRRLLDAGVPTWIGGGSAATNAIARELGAVLNLWNPTPEVLSSAVTDGPTTWGGSFPRDLDAAADLLAMLARSGVTWAVFNWPGSAAAITEAAQRAAIAR
jgi:alkanesulfonate monooxygenase SsuD/methylene tetrahydromethanopterin reductase-like flavin-dependent oxidoreductase (luciferase family)